MDREWLKIKSIDGPISEHDLKTLIVRAIVIYLGDLHCLLSSSPCDKPLLFFKYIFSWSLCSKESWSLGAAREVQII